MIITVANQTYSCSTLMLGDLDLPDNVPDFIRSIKHSIDMFNKNKMITLRDKARFYPGITPDQRENPNFLRSIRHHFSGWLVEDHAFLLASTKHQQQTAEKALEELGFQKTRRVKKRKNPDKEITLWVMPIEDLFNKLGIKKED